MTAPARRHTRCTSDPINLVDLLLVVLIALAAWSGYRRGLVFAGSDLVALAASLVCALLAYPFGVALAEREQWPLGVWAAPVAFIVGFVIARLVLGFVAIKLANAVPPVVHTHPANRALGLLPGAANGVINATVASMLLVALPLTDGITASTAESVLVSRLAAPAQWVQAQLRPIFNPAIDSTLTRLTVEPGSSEFVRLPFTVKSPKPRPDLEAAMLALVNDVRTAEGLKPLEADPEATEVARRHLVDMFGRGYFSHVTPVGDDPF